MTVLTARTLSPNDSKTYFVLDSSLDIGLNFYFKAKRVTDLNITIVVSGDIDEIVVVADLSDMLNYCNPTAKGALIKCCLLASG